MRIQPARTVAVSRWLFLLLVLGFLVSTGEAFAWRYRADQLGDMGRGCREVLGLLERPPVLVPVTPIPASKFIKGTRMYQDFEN